MAGTNEAGVWDVMDPIERLLGSRPFDAASKLLRDSARAVSLLVRRALIAVVIAGVVVVAGPPLLCVYVPLALCWTLAAETAEERVLRYRGTKNNIKAYWFFLTFGDLDLYRDGVKRVHPADVAQQNGLDGGGEGVIVCWMALFVVDMVGGLIVAMIMGAV